MHPIHGFSADLNSSLVIFSATLLHLPVSTTHVVSGSIMGVGSAERVKAALMVALAYLVVHNLF